jgi:hypothetical protein
MPDPSQKQQIEPSDSFESEIETGWGRDLHVCCIHVILSRLRLVSDSHEPDASNNSESQRQFATLERRWRPGRPLTILSIISAPKVSGRNFVGAFPGPHVCGLDIVADVSR